MADTLHIVCLDAPAPPDYGGVFDLYYKIPALAATGKKIILHYFDYKEGRNAEALRPFCQEIHAYKRASFLSCLLTGQSYIVGSRINRKLIDRLNSDAFPVLLEGIHCCGIIPFLRKDKKLLLRLHNDEAAYYRQLWLSERKWLRRLYFKREYKLLEHFQKQLPEDLTVAAVSEKDLETFRQQYSIKNGIFLPCFLPWQQFSALQPSEKFCLYHGNLSVPENRKAALFLAQEVFSKLPHRLVIAGWQANSLRPLVRHEQMELINNPSDQELANLISKAQVHVLPSFNQTGVKLKLLHVLFEGKWCMTNRAGIEGSGIHAGVHILEDAESMIQTIDQLMNLEYSEKEREKRKEILDLYNNQRNAQKLNGLL